MSYGIGQPVTRTEDPRFLTGRSTFVDDITLSGQAHAVVVYSTVPTPTSKPSTQLGPKHRPA